MSNLEVWQEFIQWPGNTPADKVTGLFYSWLTHCFQDGGSDSCFSTVNSRSCVEGMYQMGKLYVHYKMGLVGYWIHTDFFA